MKEIRLNDKFPELFEIDSEELKWYESLGFVENQYCPIEIARSYAMEVVVAPQENPTAVDSVAQSFMDGLCWYANNYRILERLSNDEQKIAVKIAKLRYVLDTVPLDLEFDYNKSEVIMIKDSVEEDYECGFEWAKKRHREKIICDFLQNVKKNKRRISVN